VGFALLMTAPLVMVWILLRREVTWRGRRYQLDASSRLAAKPTGSALATHDEHAEPLSV
jgi:hypothetical protein